MSNLFFLLCRTNQDYAWRVNCELYLKRKVKKLQKPFFKFLIKFKERFLSSHSWQIEISLRVLLIFFGLLSILFLIGLEFFVWIIYIASLCLKKGQEWKNRKLGRFDLKMKLIKLMSLRWKWFLLIKNFLQYQWQEF